MYVLSPLFLGRLSFPFVRSFVYQLSDRELVWPSMMFMRNQRKSAGTLSLKPNNILLTGRFRHQVLVYLVVHPEHRRRGIGSQLINWGKLC